ncbi:hypothetical protein PanWU01x14_167590 [Parasponia andersonii]|uniref:Aspartic peptidase domain containing protein n=1 Tax=Parasponia andersonii TaxID=3476 RepID=A0A2P5CBG3_PARAD|nr:hypothetical protein PanWU01x14_167590 [Parasponia andersonii]
MIVGRPEPTQSQEGKEKHRKRTEERVKRLRGLGHSVNHLTMGESYASTAPFAFTQQDLATMHLPHDDPLVIKLQIDSVMVGKVLVDSGSSVDVLFLSTFKNISLNRSALRPTYQPLFAFNNSKVSPLGVVTLKFCAAERCLDVDFVIIN